MKRTIGRFARLGNTRLLFATVMLLAGMLQTGCVGLWKDTQESFDDYWNKPDPLEVVKTTESGDRRARYIALLNEPAQNGGSEKQQEEVLRVLLEAAVGDPYPTCRLAAIRRLGHFQDHRAVEGLQAAYYRAGGYSPKLNYVIKQQALTSLARTGSPKAKQLLIQVVRAAAEEKDSYERQLTLDERITAIAALGEFKNEPDVADTLLQVMKSERDLALRGRAHESLQQVTGRYIAAGDQKQWDQVVQAMATGATPPGARQPSLLQRIGLRQ